MTSQPGQFELFYDLAFGRKNYASREEKSH